MAVYTAFFPGGVYPQDYVPNIPGFDYNPMFGELVNLANAVQGPVTSTAISYELENQLVLKLSGTGFAFDEGEASAGSIKKIELFQNDGTTLVSKLTLSKLSLVSFMEAAESYDPWTFQDWILNRNDTLNGSAGDEDLSGGGGNDVLNGKAGDDFMTGGEGKDKYDGGDGFDTISFADARGNPAALGGVVIDGMKGTAVDPYGNKETFKSVEGFRGTNFSDVMTGSNADNQFDGLGGRDKFDGKKGFDIVRYHRDENNGGLPGQGVEVNLGEGWAIDGFGKKDTLKNIEGVRGTSYDDILIGSKADNLLRGDGGSDTLIGGNGNDYLMGGNGADFFVFDAALDADKNVDDIEDFDVADDIIQLDLAIFAALGGTGALSADAFVANATGEATTGDHRIVYSTDSGELFYDADGNGAGAKILFARLHNAPGISEASFEII